MGVQGGDRMKFLEAMANVIGVFIFLIGLLVTILLIYGSCGGNVHMIYKSKAYVEDEIRKETK
jgi:hypothetical protein